MSEHRYAFIVRIWFESDLRGSIQSVDDTEVRYFDLLDSIPGLLQFLIEQKRQPTLPEDDSLRLLS